jgi:hypothetical protein
LKKNILLSEGLVKNPKAVIPAKAGIQEKILKPLDTGLRRYDKDAGFTLNTLKGTIGSSVTGMTKKAK